MSIRRAAPWLVGITAAVLSGCEVGNPVGDNEFRNFSVILRNTATGGDAVNIFAEDEAAGTGGALPAGGQRGYLADNSDVCPGNCSVRFTARRGAGTPNEIRTSVTCEWDPDLPPVGAEVRWNGTSLECVGWFTRSIGRWNLVGITGIPTGLWQNQAATATGTLTFVVPSSVQEGDIVPVSATFAGTMTALPGFEGIRQNITVGIVDRGVPGLVLADGVLLGPAAPSASGSVTVAGAWTIPANVTTLRIEAGGGFDIVAAPVNLVATYERAP